MCRWAIGTHSYIIEHSDLDGYTSVGIFFISGYMLGMCIPVQVIDITYMHIIGKYLVYQFN